MDSADDPEFDAVGLSYLTSKDQVDAYTTTFSDETQDFYGPSIPYTLSRAPYPRSRFDIETRFSSSPSQPTSKMQNPTLYGMLPPVRSSCSRQDNRGSEMRQKSKSLSTGDEFRSTQTRCLRPVSDLPDIYRGLFKFGVFNAVQSQCFETIMNTSENIVISAPTSSGKTVLFELAVIKLLSERPSNASIGPLCVYMAPTKALCSERFKDWTNKFSPIGIKCCELTGDTNFTGKEAWKQARSCSIIITTPEKWDSLTRNWHESAEFLSHISLFMVDEVHILHEARGATLEVCISRMKTRARPRFILVSATIPNITDISAWIQYGEPPHPTQVYTFDESYRPCKLERLVYGFPRNHLNDFQFLTTLDCQLPSLIFRHAKNRPVVVFCPTRKSVMTAAEKIASAYQQALKNKETLPWTLPSRALPKFQDHSLAALASSGVSVHHAGLSADDRRTVEDFFARKEVLVVVSTSTLAVGVNMPAHTVIIHGTRQWAGGWAEYSDLDIMQMMGRAGRPQFDKEGVAIILCDAAMKSRYEQLLSGQTVLESCLNTNLIEHITSEIKLGTISNLKTTKTWLRNSFFFQRLQKNPGHYASVIDKASHQTWQDRLDEISTTTISVLREASMVAVEDGIDPELSLISVTDVGDIMTRYYLRFPTMVKIQALPEAATLKTVLLAISDAEELTDAVRLRAEEKKNYSDLLSKHNDIRFPVKRLDKSSDKVFLLLQSILGGISLSTKEFKALGSQPNLDTILLLRHAMRVSKAIVDVGLIRKLGSHVKYGMELVRSLAGKAWEDRPSVLQQLPHIGQKSAKILAQHGITKLEHLQEQSATRIENLLHRKHPFGTEILSALHNLPNYTLSIQEENVSSNDGQESVVATITISLSLRQQTTSDRTSKQRGMGMTSVLIHLSSDLRYVDFRRIPTKSLMKTKSFTMPITLDRPSQAIIVEVNSDNFAGVGISKTYKPALAPCAFPTQFTRPPALLTAEDDVDVNSDFWDLSDTDLKVNDTPNIPVNRDEGNHTSRNPVSTSTKINTGIKQPTEPHKNNNEKLSNGNYQCKHSCSDKTSCRHLCCHEGVLRPPRHTAVKAGKEAKSKVVQGTKVNNSLDKSLEELENLHRNTRTTVNQTRNKVKRDFARSSKISTSVSELEARYGTGKDAVPESPPIEVLNLPLGEEDLDYLELIRGLPSDPFELVSSPTLADRSFQLTPDATAQLKHSDLKRSQPPSFEQNISKKPRQLSGDNTATSSLHLSQLPYSTVPLSPQIQIPSSSSPVKHGLFLSPPVSSSPHRDPIKMTAFYEISPPNHSQAYTKSSDINVSRVSVDSLPMRSISQQRPAKSSHVSPVMTATSLNVDVLEDDKAAVSELEFMNWLADSVDFVE